MSGIYHALYKLNIEYQYDLCVHECAKSFYSFLYSALSVVIWHLGEPMNVLIR